MVLGISLILISLAGLIYGIIRKSKGYIIGSIIALIIIAALFAVYSYLYSMNPY